MFYSMQCIAFCLVFSSVIHFELIFVYMDINSVDSFFCMRFPIFPAPFIEEALFSPWYVFVSFPHRLFLKCLRMWRKWLIDKLLEGYFLFCNKSTYTLILVNKSYLLYYIQKSLEEQNFHIHSSVSHVICKSCVIKILQDRVENLFSCDSFSVAYHLIDSTLEKSKFEKVNFELCFKICFLELNILL